jgi:hypothetical protein
MKTNETARDSKGVKISEQEVHAQFGILLLLALEHRVLRAERRERRKEKKSGLQSLSFSLLAPLLCETSDKDPDQNKQS